jgi:Cys-rich protein (TIGR01571 family)
MTAVAAPNQWQDSVCGCFSDFPICAQTTCCHICTASSIYAREETKFSSTCDCGSCFLLWVFSCCSCCAYPLMGLPCNTGLTCLMTAGMRRTLVQRFGIQGESVCESCLLGCCCNVCTMCQVQRELKARGQFVGGVCASPNAAPAPLPAAAPQSNPAMGGQEMQPTAGDPAAKYNTPQPVAVVAQYAQPMTDWTSGLVDCQGAPDCLEAWFCGCCVLGHMAGKFNEINGAGGSGGQADCVVTCCGYLSGLCPCCIGEQLYTFLLRREVIERYGITTESICKSAMCVCCCSPCVVAQSRREMGFHGEFPGGLCFKEMPSAIVAAPRNAVQVA